ncbi:MAG: diguanylate cyclase [Inhella sp.]|jgi:diguanylate cyclase (GGDEF)-like protein
MSRLWLAQLHCGAPLTRTPLDRMPSINPAELLLIMMFVQQSLAIVGWMVAGRLGIAPTVPAWHWAAASAFAASAVGLAVWTQDAWLRHGLANMLIPGVFVTLRLGLQTLFRGPRHDPENLLVIVLSVGLALAGNLFQAIEPWPVWVSSVLTTFCLWRCAQVVGPLVKAELGAQSAWVVVVPLRIAALLFAARGLGAMVWPTVLGVPLAQDTPVNVTVLALLMTLGILVHLCLGVAVALRLMVRLRKLSRLDALTGLPNRRAAETMLAQMVQARRQLQRPASLLVLDVDHFKRVNDEHGHLVGDRALVHIARTLQANVRNGDSVARVGGEEFLVLLPNTTLAEATDLAERLRACLASSPLRAGSTELAMTVSIGVAELAPAETATACAERADAAMYRAKRAGRNRVEA